MRDVIKKPVEQLFAKEMNRREFLAHVAAATLAVVGVSGLIDRLVSYNGSRHHQVSGYGSSSYGGDVTKLGRK